MSRPLALRGQPAPSPKEIREQDNEQAIGGMRSPAASVSRVPSSATTGRLVLDIIRHHVATKPHLLQPCRARFETKPTAGFQATDLDELHRDVTQALGIRANRPASGISADLVEGWVRHAQDPDIDLATWLRTGALLGIKRKVSHRGIFPQDANTGKS